MKVEIKGYTKVAFSEIGIGEVFIDNSGYAWIRIVADNTNAAHLLDGLTDLFNPSEKVIPAESIAYIRPCLT